MRFFLRGGLCALAMASAFAFGQSKPMAITDAKIEIGNGQTIAKGAILFQNGKILAIGENISIPADADRMSASGATIYPGFIDAYSTRGIKSPDAPPAGTPPDSRNTAPPSMWHENKKGIRNDVVVAKALDLKGELESNYKQGILTALLAPGSGSVRGVACVTNYTEKGEVLVASAGEELSFRGGGGGATGGEGYPGSLLGIVATLRQCLADAQTYAMSSSVKEDAGFENMKPLMTKQMPAIFVADTDREIYRAQNIANEFGLNLMIASGREAYKQADVLKAKGIPVLVTLDLGNEPTRTRGEGNTTPQAVLDERYQTWLDRSTNAQKLVSSGVMVGFSTAGSTLSEYLKNIRTLIKNGMPRDGALTAMTSGSAKILGIADRVGSLEVGKRANIVIMTGDFDKDSSEVQTVFVGGEKIDVKKEASK